MRRDVVRQRLDVLLDALADLKRYRSSVELETLERDRDTQHMVLHALYVASQASIDLALHALADREGMSPETYPDAFRHLAAAGLVEEALAERLAGWAGLRNVLARQYALVRYELVHRALAEDLKDLEAFAAVAAGWITPD